MWDLDISFYQNIWTDYRHKVTYVSNLELHWEYVHINLESIERAVQCL